MRAKLFFVITAIIVTISLIQGCRESTPQQTRIRLHIKSGYGKKFILEQIPFKEALPVKIDSAIPHEEDDINIVEFVLPGIEERLLRIRSDEVNMSIVFVTDSSLIDVYANYGNIEQYSFSGSPASSGMRKFMLEQDSLAAQQNETAKLATPSHASIHSADSTIQKELNDLQKQLLNRYVQYEDTVASPAAFMYFYNNVDFGNDLAAQKEFALRSAKRFPNFEPIQRLKDKTLSMIKIYEEEYAIGDELPTIELIDQNGHSYNTASLKGSYYLIDFWSSWCPQCMAYIPPKQELYKKFKDDKLKLVSVAIDNQAADWKKIIAENKIGWTQLIDTAMWDGPAVNTLKFDSIPFNFLVDPHGRIIAKAIQPTVMVSTVTAALEKAPK